MKKCGRCHQMFPLESYGWMGSTRRDGVRYRHSYCKPCRNEHKRERLKVPKVIPEGATKTCTKCATTLLATRENFHASGTGKYGFSAQCITCERQRCIEKNQRPKAKAYNRTYMAKKWREDEAYKARRNANRGDTGHVRRAREAEAPGRFTAEDVLVQYATQNGRCFWCEQPVDFDKKSIDHYIPISRGGTNYPDNIVIACRFCNTSKGAKMPQEFMEYIATFGGLN